MLGRCIKNKEELLCKLKDIEYGLSGT